MGTLRGGATALVVELGLVVLIAGLVLGTALRDRAYEAGFAAAKQEMSDRAQLAYKQGREAGAEERFDEVWNDAFIAGATQMLVLYEQGGASAMRTQLAVVKGER